MVDSITGVTSGSSAALTGSQEMGKDEFLTLLVAQLQNQDPLDPAENTEFIAQMAQFSELEQLININDNLTESINLNYLTSQSIANSMASSFLGKTITASTAAIYHASGTDSEISYNLSDTASEVKVMVYDEEGNLINVLYDEYVDKGMNKISWDGKSSDGVMMSAGNYFIKVEASSASGSPVQASPYLIGQVEKVQYIEGAAYLTINGTTVMLGDVLEIKE
jgi:flagellar basal-body rod modification protein FlgD